MKADAARRSGLRSFVLALLLVNSLPAFVVLQAAPGDTERAFVWTIHPDENARLLGVRYGNAFLLWPLRDHAGRVEVTSPGALAPYLALAFALVAVAAPRRLLP